MSTYDNALSFSASDTGTETFSFTVANESNRRMFAAVTFDAATSSELPTITYGGALLSSLAAADDGVTGSTVHMYGWASYKIAAEVA